MMGIIGCLIHEGLTGNPVWPIPVPPQPVLELAGDDIEKGPARARAALLEPRGRRRLALSRRPWRRAATLCAICAAHDVLTSYRWHRRYAGVGSFVLASLGMTFVGAIGAIREFGKRS